MDRTFRIDLWVIQLEMVVNKYSRNLQWMIELLTDVKAMNRLPGLSNSLSWDFKMAKTFCTRDQLVYESFLWLSHAIFVSSIKRLFNPVNCCILHDLAWNHYPSFLLELPLGKKTAENSASTMEYAKYHYRYDCKNTKSPLLCSYFRTRNLRLKQVYVKQPRNVRLASAQKNLDMKVSAMNLGITISYWRHEDIRIEGRSAIIDASALERTVYKAYKTRIVVVDRLWDWALIIFQC